MSATATTGSTVHGVVREIGPDLIVLALPGTDYQLHLAPATPKADLKVGAHVEGRITARAKRVDRLRSGGRFIDPVMGRPRILHGRVTAVDTQHNTLTLFCGAPFTCVLTMNQNAGDFAVGALVACDVERGAKIEWV